MRSPVSYGALRAFVEVGRLGSIKQAAAALQVTPGAISQQMKMLEATLGIRLLERTGRTVALSREGLRLFRRLRGGFQQIEAGLEPFRVSTPGAGRLVVTTPPSFASCWLASRLGNFTARHPMIEVHVDASVQL